MIEVICPVPNSIQLIVLLLECRKWSRKGKAARNRKPKEYEKEHDQSKKAAESAESEICSSSQEACDREPC